MQLIISQEGMVRCLYGEAIELASLGPLQITRASHVEPDEHGQWWADMSPVHGPKLGPSDKRSAALKAEREWVEAHAVLHRSAGGSGECYPGTSEGLI